MNFMSPSTDLLQISGIDRAFPDRMLWHVDHAVYQSLDGLPNIVVPALRLVLNAIVDKTYLYRYSSLLRPESAESPAEYLSVRSVHRVAPSLPADMSVLFPDPWRQILCYNSRGAHSCATIVCTFGTANLDHKYYLLYQTEPPRLQCQISQPLLPLEPGNAHREDWHRS